jgi:hypothetical protein
VFLRRHGKYTRPKCPPCFSSPTPLTVITGGAISHHAQTLEMKPSAISVTASVGLDRFNGVDMGYRSFIVGKQSV